MKNEENIVESLNEMLIEQRRINQRLERLEQGFGSMQTGSDGLVFQQETTNIRLTKLLNTINQLIIKYSKQN